MINFLNDIRNAENPISNNRKLINTIAILFLGISYKIDAVSGEIIGKKTEWFSRQESETVPDTSQNSDSKQRRTD